MQRTLLLCFIWTLSAAAVLAQSPVKGKVVDSEGVSLPGVSVVIKGTSTGTITDFDGAFSLNAASTDVLVFSFIGYKAQEVAVGEQTNISIVMAIETSDLDEIVVIGYGEKKKSLVTGAISSVEAKDLISSVSRPEQALQGKAAGVSVIPTSGAPGAGMAVRIRGVGSNENSNPLYIVDGMKSGDINYLDPNDIASIEVLKDAASSAIYGSEGSNGVVIITTKSGKAGQSKIEYSFQYGIQSAPKAPKFMDAHQYATYQREIYDVATYPTLPDPAKWSAGSGTDWIAAAIKEAPMSKHSLAFSGGTEKSTYMLSLGYSAQDGIIGGGDFSYFNRITARFNSTHKINDWFEVGNNIAFTNTKSGGITEDQTHNGVIQSAMMMDPTVPLTYTGALPAHVQTALNAGRTLVQDPNGNYYGISDYITTGEIYNPMVRLNGIDKNGVTKQNKVLGTVYGSLKPIEGLNITSRMGVDIAYQSGHNYGAPYYGNTDSWSPGLQVNKDELNWNTWLWENFAAYTKAIGDHGFTVMAGMSAQEHRHDWLNTSAGPMLRYDPAFAFPDNVRTEEADRVSGARRITRMASYYARASYDFKGKYMFEATVRRDGSSLFGPEKKWGTFPSFSAGWVITNEDFWTLDALSFFKLRASWGQNGSISNLGVDQYRSLITSNNVRYVNGIGTFIPGTEPERLPNPELHWEAGEQTNVGFDFRALNDKLYGTFDWYRKTTRGLLTQGQFSPELGNFSPTVNAGNVVNSGFEFSLGYREKTGAFKYDVNMNIARVYNEVTELDAALTRVAGAGLASFSNLTYFELGQPIWYFRGYQNDGIFRDAAHIAEWKTANKITDTGYNPVPGDPIVKNNVDDGKISEEDMANIGDPHHDWLFGANFSAEYKGFDLNVFAQGALGGDNFIAFIRADRPQVNRLEWFYENRWTEANKSASLPRAANNSAHFLLSDLMVDDASYLKIRQIQLGYTLPSTLSSKAKIAKLRLYASLNNFFVFTKYKGWEPEVGSGDVRRAGVDMGYYPIARSVLFGVNLTF